MMYGLGYGHAAGFGFGWFFGVIFWVLLIWAIVAFVRGGRCWDGKCDFRDGGGRGDHGDSAMRILRERYAKGEISKEEFEQRKADLTNKS